MPRSPERTSGCTAFPRWPRLSAAAARVGQVPEASPPQAVFTPFPSRRPVKGSAPHPRPQGTVLRAGALRACIRVRLGEAVKPCTEGSYEAGAVLGAAGGALQRQTPRPALAYRICTFAPERGDQLAELARAQPAERGCPGGLRRRDHTKRGKIISPLTGSYGTGLRTPSSSNKTYVLLRVSPDRSEASAQAVWGFRCGGPSRAAFCPHEV